MKVTMMKTATGCNDGINAATYEEGQTYELSEGLAKCFLDLGVALADKETEEKALKEPENKAITSKSLENKSAKSRKRE